MSSERNRLSSERNDLRAELANLQQQQKDPTERLRKRFKTVVDHAFAKCLNAAPVLEPAPERTSDEKKEQAPEIALHCSEAAFFHWIGDVPRAISSLLASGGYHCE